jgi:uncharacterized lipoprotein YajG
MKKLIVLLLAIVIMAGCALKYEQYQNTPGERYSYSFPKIEHDPLGK